MPRAIGLSIRNGALFALFIDLDRVKQAEAALARSDTDTDEWVSSELMRAIARPIFEFETCSRAFWGGGLGPRAHIIYPPGMTDKHIRWITGVRQSDFTTYDAKTGDLVEDEAPATP